MEVHFSLHFLHSVHSQSHFSRIDIKYSCTPMTSPVVTEFPQIPDIYISTEPLSCRAEFGVLGRNEPRCLRDIEATGKSKQVAWARS